MTQIRVLVGKGRYSDPWHPLEEIADRVTELVGSWADVDRADVDTGLASLDAVDALVVIATDPWRNGETGRGAPDASLRGFGDALQRGVGMVALHNAIATMRDYPEWRQVTGADWIPDVTWHPPVGPIEVQSTDAAPIPTDGFLVEDERYSDVEIDDDVSPALVVNSASRTWPMAWFREHGRSRVVVDLLGHDLRSFESVGHCTFLAGAIRWAARAEL